MNGTGAFAIDTRQLRCEYHLRYVARVVSLAVALLICLGVLLPPLPTTASETPSALATTADPPSLDQDTNGDGIPLDGIYVVALGGEEDAAKHPPNAELLTMLLLTVWLGLGVGWLLRNARRRGASCSMAFVGRSFATSCDELPSFLGVFRL